MTFLSIKRLIFYFVFSILIFSCKKLVDVGYPQSKITGKAVFASDAVAISAISSIYAQIANGYAAEESIIGLSIMPSLSADELAIPPNLATSSLTAFYTNKLSSSNSLSFGSGFWNNLYPLIFNTNAGIEGLNASTTLTASVRQQLLGEAKFMRAFLYFYLVNLYGDVPLALTTDAKMNAAMARTPKSEVYDQIVLDLEDAKTLLSQNYLDATLTNVTVEKVRPTKWAASALLSRVYLYQGYLGQNDKWAKAELESTSVITNPTFDISTVSLNNVFLKNSKEAIWQLQPVSNNSLCTPEGYVFVWPDNGAVGTVFLAPTFLDNFETGDPRRTEWVKVVNIDAQTYYLPFKYKIGLTTVPTSVTSPLQFTEYSMVLRLAEQYLIRAEARAQQMNIVGAVSDLNIIRARARGVLIDVLLDVPNSLSQSEVLTAVLKERQVELFTEWGHRWLDIKRTSVINDVMTADAPNKGTTWEDFQSLYPLPAADIKYNSFLMQNPGYN